MRVERIRGGCCEGTLAGRWEGKSFNRGDGDVCGALRPGRGCDQMGVCKEKLTVCCVLAGERRETRDGGRGRV